MNGLRDEIIAAFRQGNLLEIIYEKLRSDKSNRDLLYESLVTFHNDGEIDLIASFLKLQNKPDIGVNFFSTRNILEETLPKLHSPILLVMECVLHLVSEAGRDLAAGMLLSPFADFCAADLSRPKEALAYIENSIDQYVDLLPSVIVAGSRIDIDHYFHEAVRLSRHTSLEIRRKAVFALSRLEYPEGSVFLDDALSTLELSAAGEMDDQLLGNLVDAVFSLYKRDHSKINLATSIIKTALAKGNDLALHSAAEIICFDYSLIPDALLEILFSELNRVNTVNKLTLDYIDRGLAQIFEQGNANKSVVFLERLLLAHPADLSLEILDSVARELLKNTDNRLNHLMTKWFIQGDMVLCDGIRTVANLAYDGNVQLAVVPSEFDASDPIEVIFLARKSIGYLFSTPLTAASIIVSLMESTNTEEALAELSNLLFDPLLINYPGQLREYLTNKSERKSDNVKKAIGASIKAFDDYFDKLKSVGKIPELHPSEVQREAHRRYFSRLMSESMEKATQESALMAFFSTSVILHGNKSIDYTYGPDGKATRTEIPLQTHSTDMAFPRIGNIDSFGLDYMLLVFRAEQLKNHEANY